MRPLSPKIHSNLYTLSAANHFFFIFNFQSLIQTIRHVVTWISDFGLNIDVNTRRLVTILFYPRKTAVVAITL